MNHLKEVGGIPCIHMHACVNTCEYDVKIDKFREWLVGIPCIDNPESTLMGEHSELIRESV